MSALAVGVAVLALIAVVVLGCVLAAALRAIDRLRIDVARLRTESHDVSDVVGEALPVGSPAPPFAATAADGGAWSSSDQDGTLRLVAFARPGCPPCEELVPALLRDAERGALPPAVVVSRGAPADQPDAWRAGGWRARLVMEDEDRVSRAYRSAVAPLVFVLTPEDRVGARGIATTVDDVRALIDVAASR
jgi:thiol-disulfide isomerase/thioredoxin